MRPINTTRSVLAICFVVGLVLAPQLVAQIPTGKLVGRVQDESGAALPGVTVTATSPRLQGERSTVSDGNGNYKVAVLPPGTYRVTYELDGFATGVREVAINAGRDTKSDPVSMQLAEIAEEIVVTSELESISKTNTGSSSYTQDEVEKLPVTRTLQSATQLAPGVHTSGTNVANTTISGAMSFENLFLMNGVTMNENVRGQPFDLFIEDAIQETTVSASGISAEYGRFTGGVVNAITKSGGNEFSGSVRINMENDAWLGSNPESPERVDDITRTPEATLGGYFWKDHIWFFGAWRDFEETFSGTTAAVTDITFPRSNTEERTEGKLTISPHPSHSLVYSTFEIEEANMNRGSFTFIDTRSLTDRKLPQNMDVYNYTGILTPNFFVEAQYSERQFMFVDSGSKTTDLLEGTLMRRRGTSHRWHSPTFCGAGPPRCPPEERSNENTLAKASYFLSTAGSGTHDLVFGADTFDDVRFSINRQTGSDFTVWASDIVLDDQQNIYSQFLGTDTWIGWWAVFNEDIAKPTSFTTNSFYVNDSWQLNDKWSFNIGARYDENDGQNSSGVTTASDSKISPRFGVSYDVKGDGDLVVHGGFGTYVAAVANSQADQTTTGGAIGLFLSQYGGPTVNTDPGCAAAGTCTSTSDALGILFDWYFAEGGTNNLNDDLSQIPLLFYTSIPGVTTGVPETVKSPAAQEITLGVTKRLGNKGLFRADLVLRDWEDFYGNRVVPNDIVQTDAGPVDFQQVGNFDSGLSRKYTGLHTQGRYRFSDRFTLAGNYTWSELKGTHEGENTGSGPLSSGVETFIEYRQKSWNYPEGKLNPDQTHRLRLWGIYDILENEHHNLSVSLLQNFFSGSPYGAVGEVDPRPYVGNPGYANPLNGNPTTYFFTARDAFSTDDITRTDISLNYSFNWNAFGQDVEVFLQPEIINVFDESGVVDLNTNVADAENVASTCTGGCQPFNPFNTTPVEGVNWAKRSDFGMPENEGDYQQVRTFRFSVGFRF